MRRLLVVVTTLWTLSSRLLAQDAPLPDLTARADLWPREVALTAALIVPLVVDGKTVGHANLPAGTPLRLTKVDGANVHLTFNGSPVVTAAGNTDLSTRVQQIMRHKAQVASLPAAAPAAAPAATTTTPTSATATLGTVAKELKGALVSVQKGKLSRASDATLANTKYIAVYFSASWCPPCRKFTPELVKFYNKFKPQHADFELVFVSWDRAGSDMEKYMESDAMPWPALAYNERKNKPTINGLAGNGIPCLVLIDASGKVLSHSYEDGKYVGPYKVLKDIEAKVGTP